MLPARWRRQDRLRRSDGCVCRFRRHHTHVGCLRPAGAIGMMTWDECVALWCTVLSAFTVRRCCQRGSPVFGFTSNLGKLLLEMSIRIRFPFLKTFAVGNGSMVNS